MLSRRHRIVRGDDYRSIVRRGRRVNTQHAVVYVRSNQGQGAARFGFIVAKTVGVAVTRNLVRRRLKSVAAGVLEMVPSGTDVVIRALPGSAQASWATLNTEITGVLTMGVTRS